MKAKLNELPSDSSDRITEYKLSLLQLIVDKLLRHRDADCALKMPSR